jgi:hypothetical protein
MTTKKDTADKTAAASKAKEAKEREVASLLDKARKVLTAADAPLTIHEIVKRGRLQSPQGAKLYRALKASDDFVHYASRRALFDLAELKRPEGDA